MPSTGTCTSLQYRMTGGSHLSMRASDWPMSTLRLARTWLGLGDVLGLGLGLGLGLELGLELALKLGLELGLG